MFVYIGDDVPTYQFAMDASEILESVRNIGLLHGRILGDAGDAPAQRWIARALEQHRPDDGLLLEEAADNRECLDSKRVWTIDPPDGTREFASGRQGWAVYVALVEDGQSTHAAIGLSSHGQVSHTGEAKAMQGPCVGKIVISCTRPPAVAEYVADKLGMELVEMGSAGVKAMHVLLGDFDAYIYDDGQYEWDSTAPVGVAKPAGLFASRPDGSVPTYSSVDTFLSDMLFCRSDLSEGILAAVKEFRD